MFANLIAIALKRVYFIEIIQEILVYIESERLCQTGREIGNEPKQRSITKLSNILL
jgi:hypothetical protein